MGDVDVACVQMEKNAGTKTNGQAVDLNVIAAEDGAAQVSSLRIMLTVPIAAAAE